MIAAFKSPCEIKFDLAGLKSVKFERKITKITPFDRIHRNQILTCDLVWALMTTLTLEPLQPKTRMCVNAVLVQVEKIQRILFHGGRAPLLRPTEARKYQRILINLKRLITEGYGPTVQWDFHNGVIMKVCKVCDELGDNTPNCKTLPHWRSMVNTLITICAQMEAESSTEQAVTEGEETFNRINKIMERS